MNGRFDMALVLFAWIVFSGARAGDAYPAYQQLPAVAGEKCVVCGGTLTEKDIALIVKGRRVPLDRQDVAEFMNNQEKYFATLQPRGALFAEAAEAPEGTALGGVTSGWFLAGAYVLVALVFGAMSSYAAIGKGLAPIPCFIIGFCFTLFGYIYVLTRRRMVTDGDIPAGLVKVPATRSPLLCGKCSTPNHPSARTCIGCGVRLEPKLESEAARVH